MDAQWIAKIEVKLSRHFPLARLNHRRAAGVDCNVDELRKLWRVDVFNFRGQEDRGYAHKLKV